MIFDTDILSIGSHLANRLLELGYEVVGMDCFTDYYPRRIKEVNISNALSHNNFEFIEKDILEMDKFPRVDYVFHLAAQAGVRALWGKNFELCYLYYKANIEYARAQKGDVKHSYADISKAKKIVGYEPKYSQGEGLKVMIKWF